MRPVCFGTLRHRVPVPPASLTRPRSICRKQSKLTSFSRPFPNIVFEVHFGRALATIYFPLAAFWVPWASLYHPLESCEGWTASGRLWDPFGASHSRMTCQGVPKPHFHVLGSSFCPNRNILQQHVFWEFRCLVGFKRSRKS